MNKYKTWLFKSFLITFIGLLLIVLVNIIVDPLGVFKHKIILNEIQNGFNERLQKTTQIKYKYDNLKDIDTLIFGSSRTTYYDQTKFKNVNAFNYAFAFAMPQQFDFYIDFAKKIKGDPFKNIILGLDFYGTKEYDKNKFDDKNIINEVDSNIVLSKFFSIDLLKQSLINIKNYVINSDVYSGYTRDNIVKTNKIEENIVQEIALKRIIDYHNYENYKYNQNYENEMKALLFKNKDSKFIIFTTPLSEPFLKRILNDDNLSNGYYRWIEDMVRVFNEIYFFTYHNNYSINYKKLSQDGDHYYPKSIENITMSLMEKEKKNNDGIIINSFNINEALEFIKKQNGKLINEKN